MTTHSNTPKGQLSDFSDAAMSATQKEAVKGSMFLMAFMPQTLVPVQQTAPQQPLTLQAEPEAQAQVQPISLASFMDEQIRCSIATSFGRSW